MKQVIRKYAFILTGFVFGYLLLVTFNPDVSSNTYKLFIPVAVMGLLFGEIANIAIKRYKTSSD
ncbi:hypothetical protein ACTHPB_29280 [Priestia megaterium]|uniref:hypothetical protein n=1 Tax=Priestia megaterium TaxID=1404 RepID=UPI003F7D87C2